MKNRINKAYVRFKITGKRSEYENTRAQFDALNRYRYGIYIEDIQNGFVSSTRKFWEYTNYEKETTGFPSKMTYKENAATNETANASLFADFFNGNLVQPSDTSSIDEILSRATTNTRNIILSLEYRE